MPIPDSPSATSSSQSGRRHGNTGAASKLAAQIRHQFGWLGDQATNKAGQLAETGKDQLAVKLDDVSGIVASMAGAAEENYGPAAGRLVHRAAESMSSAAEGLRSKSVHGLVSSSRSVIRQNVGAAIGTAALVGFVAARIAKGGTADVESRDDWQAQTRSPTQPQVKPASAGAFA